MELLIIGKNCFDFLHEVLDLKLTNFLWTTQFMNDWIDSLDWIPDNPRMPMKLLILIYLLSNSTSPLLLAWILREKSLYKTLCFLTSIKFNQFWSRSLRWNPGCPKFPKLSLIWTLLDFQSRWQLTWCLPWRTKSKDFYLSELSIERSMVLLFAPNYWLKTIARRCCCSWFTSILKDILLQLYLSIFLQGVKR